MEFYGWGVFIAAPFGIGFFASLIYGSHQPRKTKEHIGVGLLAVLFTAGLALIFAIEGIICLIMAFPIWLPCTLIGSLLGVAMSNLNENQANQNRFSVLLLLSLPGLIGLESVMVDEPPLRKVQTRIYIDAPPHAVWDNVIAFPPLERPDQWLFKSGIAYPTSSRIEGSGVGAIRYCNFSTGPFVEPITLWEPARTLAFDVIDQPRPMNEWSPYQNLEPAHLHGFMQSQRGRFDLIPTANGGTELIGTTWYTHDIWPNLYWTRWSDYIIHRIHCQVLEHIKNVTTVSPETSHTSLAP